MPIDPTRPILQLKPDRPVQKPPGRQSKIPRPAKFTLADQQQKFGPRFQRLADVLEREGALELRNDPTALAPERLLVFEVRGSIQNFLKAARNIPGLEFLEEDELEEDEHDKSPALYLFVPDARALNEIVSLWTRWSNGESLGRGYAPWQNAFSTLRDIRPWGAIDRIKEDAYFLDEDLSGKNDDDRIRLEIELVYRSSEEVALSIEGELRRKISERNGNVICRSRINDIAYHALLIELPASELKNILQLSPGSIAELDPILHIRPQSTVSGIDVGDAEESVALEQEAVTLPPILALLDGVPVAQHALLHGSLIVEDIFDLEPNVPVSNRVHGTAMASLIIHGDRNENNPRLGRQIIHIPVLGSGDEFPNDKLIVDLIYQAVLKLKAGNEPIAANTLIINISLGNKRKIFQGRLSAWAKLLDRLSYQFGILFIVSAGNHTDPFEIAGLNNVGEYENLAPNARGETSIGSLAQLVGSRRLLSPSESMNSITIGAANVDSVNAANRRSVNIDPYPAVTISNPSSALGPGYNNSIKPDVLLPGSKEHLRFVNNGNGLVMMPCKAARQYGLKVAAPPVDGIESVELYTGGTSAASALASRACHQIYDALESAYHEGFTGLHPGQRTALLKALLIHTSKWPDDGSGLIKQIIGPQDGRLHVQQRDNIRRFIGYGLADPEAAISCTTDRASFWAVGSLGKEQNVTIQIPIPALINGVAQPHRLTATLAWLTPTLPGNQAYKAVRLCLLSEDDDLFSIRVESAKPQPDENQCKRGTVISRRWEGGKAPVLGDNPTIKLTIQRDPDNGIPIDEDVYFGLAVTLTMPGVEGIYEEVRDRIQPETRLPVV